MFPQLNLLLGVAAFVGTLALGAALGYRFEAGKLAELKLQYAQAEVQARAEAASIQKAQDDVALGAAQVEASTQAAQASLTERQIDEVKTYVPAGLILAARASGDRACIPYGFVRVLDASALGLDPGALILPAGQSDDACAPIDAAALARSIVANYGAARANAEQLNRLELTILQLEKASHDVPSRSR